MKVEISLHPKGLHPTEAAKAWQLRQAGEKWDDVMEQVVNLQGKTPCLSAVKIAVARVGLAARTGGIMKTNYTNCGRKKELTKEQEKQVVAFVKKWRSKRFCTCRYIVQELKLKVDRRTVNNVLNRHGYHWRPVPKTTSLSKEDLQKRRTFVEKFENYDEGWWESNMNMALDGVTLTMAPRPLNARQKHMSQRITHMWMKKGERQDNEVHTYNRYGVQLGTKVPLWGGFTGGGQFTLRMWTPRAKMTKAEWAGRIPGVKRSIDKAAEQRATIKAKVWHDNEKFLLNQAVYRRNGMEMINFPPNSGDLNPIETVWARLRLDLAKMEQKDFSKKPRRYLSTSQFKARVASLLKSYGEVQEGEEYSFLTKLVRGMPKRLAGCRAKHFGRCGK